MLRLTMMVQFGFNFPWGVDWPTKIPTLDESALEWSLRDRLAWPGSPPLGECFQLWQIFCEGATVASPVFNSLDELADWCTENSSIFGDEKGTKEEWLSVLRFEKGWIDVGNREVISPKKRIFTPEDRINYISWCERLLPAKEVSRLIAGLDAIFGE